MYVRRAGAAAAVGLTAVSTRMITPCFFLPIYTHEYIYAKYFGMYDIILARTSPARKLQNYAYISGQIHACIIISGAVTKTLGSVEHTLTLSQRTNLAWVGIPGIWYHRFLLFRYVQTAVCCNRG